MRVRILDTERNELLEDLRTARRGGNQVGRTGGDFARRVRTTGKDTALCGEGVRRAALVEKCTCVKVLHGRLDADRRRRMLDRGERHPRGPCVEVGLRELSDASDVIRGRRDLLLEQRDAIGVRISDDALLALGRPGEPDRANRQQNRNVPAL